MPSVPSVLLLAVLLAQPDPGAESVPAASVARGEGTDPTTLLRRIVGEVAVQQLERIDPAWHPDQRDCAGLVRHAYRSAYRRLRPERLKRPLWRDGRGEPSDFADAETLLRRSFVPLGRGDEALAELRTGDLLAFRQVQANREPIFHLMLVVVPEDRAHGPARVIYHPGAKGAALRTGLLRTLAEEAPLEWRPTPANRAFLGFFRFREWMS